MGAISNSHIFKLTLILLLAAALRVVALGQDVRFHPDEAFFATFARQAVATGNWWLPGALDKTPLSIYASAVSMHTLVAYTDDNLIYVGLRAGEFAARLPGMLAAVVLVALVVALVHRTPTSMPGGIYAVPTIQRSVYMAAVLAAMSPYLLVFAATAFTDGFMLLFMVAALLAVQRGRAAGGGGLLALSFASKQQGLLYVPLLLGLLALRRDWRGLVRFLVVLVLGVGLVLLWDTLRPGDSLFVQAALNNDPGRLFAAPEAWLPRLGTWLGYAGWMLGPPWLTWPLLTLVSLRRADWPLAAYVVGYLLLHVLVAFNTYDRYLLPIVPLVILLAGQGLTRLPRPLLVGVVLVLVMTGFSAARGEINLGRDDYPRQSELLPLVNYLDESTPFGAIIYNRWLSWELGYYLGAWSDKRQAFYPTPAALLADWSLNPEPVRYFVVPKAAPYRPWLADFVAGGLRVIKTYENADYRVYALRLPVRSTS